jgi:hypothetical protein
MLSVGPSGLISSSQVAAASCPMLGSGVWLPYTLSARRAPSPQPPRTMSDEALRQRQLDVLG